LASSAKKQREKGKFFVFWRTKSHDSFFFPFPFGIEKWG